MIGEITMINKEYEVVVVGGGLSGLCAALSSARYGVKTALVQNRPVLGGNASSEIRMHICGADYHASRPNARETGILEELLLENRKNNYSRSFSIFDTVLWEKATFQENLELFLNTQVTNAIANNKKITQVQAFQLTTEKEFAFTAKIFVDATGDGFLSHLVGAEYMYGREGASTFNEKNAPEEPDDCTMGNTLMFKAVNVGEPVPFEKPFWANIYNEEQLIFRGHKEITSGYWWVELGGNGDNVITDGEIIRDELLKAVYGVWDHIKNGGNHNAENYALDWVGFLPGKRESRRVIGDIVLTETDLLEGKIFDDAVAYGGWPMDMHVPGGLTASSDEPTQFIKLSDVYTIPYRSLYSKNIKNLMLGGRNISVSRMAFGSTRVMATCAVIGQAVGSACGIAIENDIMPREVLNHITELQQRLMRDDCFIPGFKNTDILDMARNAKIECSSQENFGPCENIKNGYDRQIKEETNCWVSKKPAQGQWISLEFDQSISPKEIIIKFDSNLSKEIMTSLSDNITAYQIPGIPPQIIKDYKLDFYENDKLVHTKEINNNYLRYNKITLNDSFTCNMIKLTIIETHGISEARIFEIRVYPILRGER